MKTNLILTILAAIVVFALNYPDALGITLMPNQTIAMTLTVFFILIAYQTYAIFKQSKLKSEVLPDRFAEKTEITKQCEVRLPDYVPGLHTDELLQTIFQAYDQMPEGTIRPDKTEKERLSYELDTYRQAYLWCIKMQELYGRQWLETFQGADLPLSPDKLPAMRSIIAEVAIQTADFCRYRTGDINLKERMTVNPRIVLLDCKAAEAGAQPLSDNPFEIPKEVHALHELFKHDNIRLNKASIHGFLQPENE